MGQSTWAAQDVCEASGTCRWDERKTCVSTYGSLTNSDEPPKVLTQTKCVGDETAIVQALLNHRKPDNSTSSKILYMLGAEQNCTKITDERQCSRTVRHRARLTLLAGIL